MAAVVSIAILLWELPARADYLGRLTAPFQDALMAGEHSSALGLIFLAGLATALTPCVYPMIAITVSVFGARQTESRLQGALLSTAFVLGIAALFTPLGIISAMSGNAFGSALASPWVLSMLALIFIAMGLSMLGLFDVALPSSLQNRLSTIGGSGYRGAFGVGFVNGLIAAPCTGPVLAVLLAWVATTKSVGFGALSLFVYAIGLGTLFWIVGTFAITLPKSGKWVGWTKSVFGIAMIALGLYYIRAFLPYPTPVIRSQPWLLASLALLVAGIGMGAIHLSFGGSSTAHRFRKAMGTLACIAGVLGTVGWAEALNPGAHIEWGTDYQEAKAIASAQTKPLLVDFGADWCGACKELERGPLSDPRVVSESQRFVTVRIDLSADKTTDEKMALLKSYNQPGLPLMVLHRSDGQEHARVTGLVSSDELLQMLTSVR